MIQRLTILTVFLIGFIGCAGHNYMFSERISGNGDIVTETRDVGYFTELRVTGARSTVVYGDVDGPIRLTGDSNILENTVSYIDGDRLVITSKRSVSMNPTQRVEIEIPSTRLNAVRVSGSNRIVLNNIEQNTFAIRGSGSTRVEANGYADILDIRMSGSSQIDAPDLISESAAIRTSGSSKAVVNVSGKLESRSSGSSEIVVHGNPTEIVNQSSGSSRLRSVSN